MQAHASMKIFTLSNEGIHAEGPLLLVAIEPNQHLKRPNTYFWNATSHVKPKHASMQYR